MKSGCCHQKVNLIGFKDIKVNMEKLLIAFFLLISTHLCGEVLKKEGSGYLEIVQEQQVLHLKGTPYELGYQHGVLLKEQIAQNVSRFVDRLSSDKAPPVVQDFINNLPVVIPHIPESIIKEMEGLAEGSGIPYSKILMLNLFPEMFHCSGITVANQATTHGELYHVRVLDYSIGISIQNTAVMLVVQPIDGYSFVNVTYAGFIGSVTGMNNQKIALGEIGGKGHGSWNGLPMAFLLRQVLEKTANLDEVKNLLKTTPRTCEYYYIFSDGKNRDSFAAYVTADRLDIIPPGTSYAFFTAYNSREYPAHNQPKDTIVITRWDKYEELEKRLLKNYGKITIADLKEIIKRPVAHPSNLHNAIFSPETSELWVAHAGPQNEIACDMPYQYFSLQKLLDSNGEK